MFELKTVEFRVFVQIEIDELVNIVRSDWPFCAMIAQLDHSAISLEVCLKEPAIVFVGEFFFTQSVSIRDHVLESLPPEDVHRPEVF